MSVKFSVLLSLYDKESPANLRQALNSLFQQTLQPDQVVIVFDGPLSYELEQIVEGFNDLFNDLTIVRIKYNMGLAYALQAGIPYCKYEYVARMDTDDICYINRFEKQIQYLSIHSDVSVLGTTVQEFDKTPADLDIFRKLPLKMPEIMKFARFRNPINHPSVIFRKSDVLAAGSYQEMPLFEDFYLWIRMLQKGYVIENLEEPLLHFRTGNDMIGRRHGPSYLKKELIFLSTIRRNGFLDTKRYLISAMIKIPLRMLPKKALEFFYRKALR
jgi:glycosyltransferase involved in cell wall biosynthesis